MIKTIFSLFFLYLIIDLLLSADSWIFKMIGILIIVLILIIIIKSVTEEYIKKPKPSARKKIEKEINISGDELFDFVCENEEELENKDIKLTLKEK